ncbi:MAG: glycogen synthase GlgA [Planctomycetes bacterium]|nr:glycogen synthase GlgA [Planctomycetota bacterium]
MRIAIVVPECDPFAKVGGLADVAGSLPRALRSLGHEVAVFLPRYAAIPERLLEGAEARGEVRVQTGEVDRTVRILEARLGEVPAFLLEEPRSFGRPGVYGENGIDYPDNPERFAVLSLGALLAMDALGFAPEVLHVHDWQTALVPVYRRVRGLHRKAGVLFTIHNLAYQGLHEKEILPRLGIPWDLFAIEGLEFYGRANLLKGGLVFSTLLNTVSPTYAREIQEEEMGVGLDGVLRHRARDLSGILNGIDPEAWNPASGREVAAPFSAAEPSGKRKCKAALQRELGLEVGADRPLFGAVGRLDPQKGFDLVSEVGPRLLDRGAQLAVLGTGHEAIAGRLRALASQRPDRCSVTLGFAAPLARRIYAGADFFLMPSRFEPCGLGQMIAMRYGTIPVVRATGGLADTVRDVGQDPERGNGYAFGEFTAGALQGALDRALEGFAARSRFERIVARAMREDFSWTRSAKAYVDLYARAARQEAG